MKQSDWGGHQIESQRCYCRNDGLVVYIRCVSFFKFGNTIQEKLWTSLRQQKCERCLGIRITEFFQGEGNEPFINTGDAQVGREEIRWEST